MSIIPIIRQFHITVYPVEQLHEQLDILNILCSVGVSNQLVQSLLVNNLKFWTQGWLWRQDPEEIKVKCAFNYQNM